MVDCTVILRAEDERERLRYTRSEARQVIGNAFPITDIHGRELGEGRIRAAQVTAEGQRLVLTVAVPDHLAKGFETDTGSVVGKPRTPLPGLPGA
jgi:hypothetical protein